MAPISSITVCLRMPDGEIRPNLRLRAVTYQDELDLEAMLAFAVQRGLYSEETQILGWYGLGGESLFWPGLGVQSRFEFEKISRGTFRAGILWMSNPWRFVEQPDDLAENCLCQDDTTCQTCRLQRRVKDAEFKQLQAEHDRDVVVAKLAYWQSRIGSHAEAEEVEVEEVEDSQVEGYRLGVFFDIEEAESRDGEGENQPREKTKLISTKIRSEMAEAANQQLRTEIECLKRENTKLRNETQTRRTSSTTQTTQITDPTTTKPSVGDISGDSQGNILQTGSGKIGRKTMGGKIGGKSRYAESNAMKVATKRLRDADEDKDEGDNLEDLPKRHQPVKLALDRTTQPEMVGRKTVLNNCGSKQLAKKHQNVMDEDEDDDDDYDDGGDDDSEYHESGAQHHGLVQSRKTNHDSDGLAPTSNQNIAKAGRRTNNSANNFLDAVGANIDADTPNITKPSFLVSRARGWSDGERQALTNLIRAHRNPKVGLDGKMPEVLHDAKLFELMSRQLQQQGIIRSPHACKNEWNRRGRELSGIDNRKVPNPNQMSTSVQWTK